MVSATNLRWMKAAAVIAVVLLGLPISDYAQITKDKGVEAQQFSIDGKDTMRLKIYATLPEGTNIEVTIGSNKITFTWTADEVKQNFLDTGYLEMAGSEILVKLADNKTPNECRIPAKEVPKDNYKAFCTKRPAIFSITSLDFPRVAGPNTSVSIAATIKNIGDEDGAKDVWLEVDSKEIARQTRVSLGVSKETVVRFTPTFGNTGKYSVRVVTPDDAKSGGEPLSIEVRDACFRVGGISVNPRNSVPINTTVSFTAVITNPCEKGGTKNIEFYVQDRLESSRSVTLLPNQNQSVSFPYTCGTPTSYTIKIKSPDDYSSSTITCFLRPATFSVGSINPSPGSSFRIHTTATFTATITNNGDLSGTKTIDFLVDGRLRNSKSLPLQPGKGEPVSFNDTFNSAGRPKITIKSPDDRSELTLDVWLKEAFFECIQSSFGGPAQANKNTEVYFSARFKNTGDKSGTKQIRLKIDGNTKIFTFPGQDPFLVPGGEKGVSLSYSFPSAGQYSVRMESDDSGCVGHIEIK